MRNLSCIWLCVLFSLSPVLVFAGDLEAPAAPTSPGSAMYTLEAIYNRLDAGTPGSKRTGAFTEPTSGPTAGTGHTLDEVMGKAPSVDDTNGAGLADVLADKTFWGLTSGAWGTKTGTMTNRGAGSTITPGTSDQTIAAGYWSSANTVSGDADLAAANVRCGKTIFGVTGTLPPGCVAKTGQTTCYNASGDVIDCATTGQDGEYQKGCDPAVSPSGDSNFGNYKRTSLPCSPAGFTDNGDGTVTDNLTGLVWLTNANCTDTVGGVVKSTGYLIWTNALIWSNALASGACSLKDGSLAGDWRLPNINELRSLFDSGLSMPYLPAGHPFDNVQFSAYCSSSTYAGYTSLAWGVGVSNGYVYALNKGYNVYVWPVRSGN